MKTPTSRTLSLAGKMKTPHLPTKRAGKRNTSSLYSPLNLSALLLIFIAAAFYTTSSASSVTHLLAGNLLSSETTVRPDNKTELPVLGPRNMRFLGSGGFLPALTPQAGPDEFIATYEVVAGLCTSTPKTTFNLGETVCARATNAPLREPSPLRRFNWADTKGFVRQTQEITTDPEENLFALPVSNTSIIDGETVDNRGIWSVSLNSTGDSGTRAIAYFNVSDPANAAADLIVYNVSTESDPISPGASTGFALVIANTGPDTAEDVHVTQATPPFMTFVSTTEDPAATFNCVNDAGVTDCSIASLPSGAKTIITINYTVSGSAPNGVISSVADISSDTNDPRPLSNSSQAQVEVRAAGAPAATCALGCPSDVIVTADAMEGGQPGAFVTLADDVEVSGDCGAVSTTPASGSFFPVGTSPVSVTSSTGGGSCSFTVTVLDSPAPIISCPPNQTAQAPAGETHTTVNPGTATATGTGVSVTGVRSDIVCQPQPGESTCNELSDPYPVGTTTITWTATDADGRTASCQQTITVTSADALSISCPPDRSFSANDCAGFTATASDIGSPTTTGGQEPIQVVARRSDNLDLTADPYPVGQTVITWTATDNVGRVASCTQTINVATGPGGDNTPPTLSVPSNVFAITSSCTATLDDELGVATAEDNCSAVSISRTGVPTFDCPVPGDPGRQCESFVFPTGTTVITYTATDASGNNTVGTQNVTVTENPAINPTITAPADSSAFADGSCLAPVPDYTADSVASDNCSFTLSQSPAAGTLVGFGPHTVTVTATDPSGNSASDTVVFTVNDNTPPTITAPADSSAFADASCLAAVPDYRPGTVAADNCGGVTLSQSPEPGTLVGFGPHTVTVTADDGHGNTASDDVVFTVNDNTPPVFTSCPSNITLEPTCPTGAIATYATPTATDNCATPTVQITVGLASGSVFPIGTTTVTHVADDGHGNTATCTFTVTVQTPQTVVQNLISSVTASSLTGTQKNGLLAKLNAALDGINEGKINVACNKLSDFVNSVENLISHGDITAAQGNAWISSANHVRNTIGCTSLACS